MPKIAVLVEDPDGSRLLASESEREVALMTESVIDGIAPSALPVPIWVHCADTTVLTRLTSYFAGVQDELVADVP